MHIFLTTVKAKGKHYIYLRQYKVRDYYTTKKETLFGFGRKEKAIKIMYEWQMNFSDFPQKLIGLGCNESDLKEWINTMETGITKTGRSFKGAI